MASNAIMARSLESTKPMDERIREQNQQILRDQERLSIVRQQNNRRMQDMLERARSQRVDRLEVRVTSDVTMADLNSEPGIADIAVKPVDDRGEYASWSSNRLIEALQQKDDLIASLQQQLESLKASSPKIASIGEQSLSPSLDSASNGEFVLPRWYSELPRGKAGPRPDNAVAKELDTMRRNAKNLKNLSGPQLLNNTEEIRDMIQKFFFTKIDRPTIIAGKALEGLAWIAQSQFVPWDIRSDAAELFRHWAVNENFGGDIMYGIVIGKDKPSPVDQDPAAKSAREGLSLDPKFAKRQLHKEWGNNGLQNGQWWPYQLCTIRDGAHGHTQGGIAGVTGRGAYSIVIASRSDYTDGAKGDLDEGNELWYMGTIQESGNAPTAATQLMLDAYTNKKDIRVLRSHRDTNTSKPSVYAPETGFRYDGLYRVVDYELADAATYHYRFHLVRNAGQEPIRYQGPEKRPNKREIAAAKTFQAQMAGKKRRRLE